jgi:hypothetical protein
LEPIKNDRLNISELNDRLNKYKNECGCSLGAQFMSVALVGSLIFYIYRYHLISLNFIYHLPCIILITIGAAGIGKLSGIAYAKYKYRKLSEQLTNYLYKLTMEEPNNARNMD